MIHVRTVCSCDRCGVSAYCDSEPGLACLTLITRGWVIADSTVLCPDCRNEAEIVYDEIDHAVGYRDSGGCEK